MPRPKNKSELEGLAQANYDKLVDQINQLPIEERNEDFPPGTMNRNIADVLCHLHHWHKMLMTWHEIGMQGEKPAMPAEGYTWKDSAALNQKIWEQYKDQNLEESMSLFTQSHKQVFQLIEKYSNEELFEKKRFKWTGTTSLGAYFISATSSHYDWAIKLIKRALKTRKLNLSQAT